MAEQKGKVYLVGAGPGDITYLTVRGQQLLTQAEVVVYDALIDPQLLELTPVDCLHLNMGKRGASPGEPLEIGVAARDLDEPLRSSASGSDVRRSLSRAADSPEASLDPPKGSSNSRLHDKYPGVNQAEIDHLLVEQCQIGKRVVRLKNGDPFIFGRCASEIAALRAAGCDFEVVPGLSSALAVPLLAGIPLTDPVLSRCFTVLSAHDPSALDWPTLARIDTLVILMGGKCLREVIHQLQLQGRLPQTPVAVIRWGGRSDQQVWRGTLANILGQVAGESLSPAIITIGEVARLQLHSQDHSHADLSQFPSPSHPDLHSSSEHHPVVARSVIHPLLAGKTILVTRSVGQSSQFNQLLKHQGAQVIEMPALEIGPPSSWDALDKAIADLAFDWLILTSTNGVDFFFERLWSHGKDSRALAGVQIAVVGQKTAASLDQQGIKPDFIPPNFVADSLVAHLPNSDDLTGTRILFPRVETGGRDTLVAELTAKGAEVVEVPAYESRCPAIIDPLALDALKGRAVDVITFASSKTVKNFCQLLSQAATDDPWSSWLKGVCLASIGPQTSKTCMTLLGRVDIQAEVHTLEGLTQAIIKHYHGRNIELADST